MPNFRDCKNCLGPKDPERYGDYLCGACQKAADEAVEFATREGHDPGQARRTALGRLVPGSMSRKHPSQPFVRMDTAAIEERLKNGA